jgi:hypothetical protein
VSDRSDHSRAGADAGRSQALVSHRLRCRCGTLTGYVSHPEKARRGVCYCRDCQAYAHALARDSGILDAQGGTDVVATLQSNVSLTHGAGALACLSLSPNGLLRWYASCCNTAIGNTTRNFRMSYVGLVHTCLHDAAESLDDAFGPVRMRVNTKSALGPVDATPSGTLMAVAALSCLLVRARIDGSYRRTPFFDPQGIPFALPRVLTRDERARAMEAGR